MRTEQQKELFPDLTPGNETRLRVEKSRARPPTKRQKQFDRQLRKVEGLRTKYRKYATRWEQFLKIYEREIHPAEMTMNARRIEWIECVAVAWQGRNRLGKRQRETIANMLHREIETVFEIQPERADNHDWLPALRERLRANSLQAVMQSQEAFRRDLETMSPEEADVAREMMNMFISEMGFDPERFSTDMDAAAFTAEFEQQLRDGLQRDDETPAPQPESPRKETAAQKRAAAKAAEREKVRKRTLSRIYKQLAKIIHPDLETDPQLRAEKERVMQELTAAHRERDLHTLLQLELQWLEGEGDRLEALADDKLDIYLDVLREQTRELTAQIEDLPGEPRFQAITRFADQWDPLPVNPAEVLSHVREITTELETEVAELRGPGAMELLRQFIKSEQEQRKMAERMFPFLA